MKVKIQPNRPLAPLNDLFPEGISVIDEDISVMDEPAYLLDIEGVHTEVLRQIVKIVSSDKMPFSIFLTLQLTAELAIPKGWTVCTNELNSMASL